MELIPYVFAPCSIENAIAPEFLSSCADRRFHQIAPDVRRRMAASLG